MADYELAGTRKDRVTKVGTVAPPPAAPAQTAAPVRTDRVTKVINRETLAPYQRANTGGDTMDRMQGRYAKVSRVRPDEPFKF